MQHFFQSPFLQALGFAIANSVWQTALIWVLYLTISNFLPFSAAAKYRLAIAAQFTSFSWFIITLQFYYTQYNDAGKYASLVGSQNAPSFISGSTSQIIYYMAMAEQALPYVSMAYLVLMLLLLARWIISYSHTQQVRKNGLQKIAVDWRLFIKKTASQLGIKKEIRIFLSEKVTTPLTIGFLTPIILIPVASINHLTTDQLEAVMLHELAHIKRYDYLVNMIISVIEISLFFNPFTQLLHKTICKERENSCDDWVLQFQYNAPAYAEALLRIASLQACPAFAMAATHKKNDLLLRVKRMMGQQENRFNYRKQLLAFFMITGMLASIAWLTPLRTLPKNAVVVNNHNAIQKIKIPAYAVEPMAIRVDNPLFNPVFFLSAPLKAEMKKNLVIAEKEINAIPSHSGDRKDMGLIKSIPAIVANALEQASFEMTEKSTNWNKELEKMEFAKINMEKNFRMDSLFFLKGFVPLASKDIESSLEFINADILKMKKEMKKVSDVKINFSAEREKARRDIQKAMEELKKIGPLDKLVLNALTLPGILFEKDKNDRPIPKIFFKRKQAEIKPIPQTEEVDGSEKEIILPKITEETEDRSLDNIVVPDIRINLSSILSGDKVSPELLTFIRMKLALIKKSIDHAQLKIIATVSKEKRTTEKQFIIRLQ